MIILLNHDMYIIACLNDCFDSHHFNLNACAFTLMANYTLT